MKDSITVDALVSMSAKIITLRLDEVRGQALAPEGIEIRQRSGHCRCRHPEPDRQAYRLAPLVHPPADLLCKILVQEQVGQVGIALEGLPDPVEKYCPDNAAPFPDPRHLARFDAVVELARCAAQKVESLGVRADLGSIEGRANLPHDFLLVRTHGTLAQLEGPGPLLADWF